MALSGDEDKEMRISGGGLTYDPNENFDHHHQHHHHHIPAPDQALGAAAAAVVMNSGGSNNKSRSPVMGSSPRIASVRYRECLKNHAASIGGNVTDGCGEFMPTGEEGSLEALKCAACNCHRNFHRKEPVNPGGVGGGGGGGAIIIHPLQHPPPPPPQIPSLNHHHHSHHHHRVAEPLPIHSSSNHHWAAAAAGMVQPVKMAFGGGGGGGGGGSASGGTDSSSDQELNFYTYQSTSVQPPPQYVLAKKRFRTKFTPEQKEKMMAFAEKLGWRIPREDDTEVQRFCAENGVKRQVFKVWMHNNKNSGKKNPDDQS